MIHQEAVGRRTTGSHLSGRSRKHRERCGAEQSGGLQVEIDSGLGMVPQDGRGRHRTNGPIETGFDGRCFAGVRNDGKDFLGLENLAHGHGNGLHGNSVKILEPSFADLLEAAGVVEGNDNVRLFCVEIGGRIVKSDVAIFADTQESDIDWRSRDGFADGADYLGGVLAPIEEVIMDDACLCNQVLLKKFAEACRVGHGQTDIFVQVEELDLLPADAWCCGQVFEEFELGRGAGGYDTSLTMLCNRVADG